MITMSIIQYYAQIARFAQLGNLICMTTNLTSAAASQTSPRRILVTGGGTFLGDNIAASLLAAGVEVTLLVRPGAEDRLGALAQRARWFVGDVWNPGSLKGRGRGHQAVIHTVGGMTADAAQGLTYDWLNLASARNVANMCVNAGVPQMVLISAARAPWVNSEYIRAKREAERYITRVGLHPLIIRAPVLYLRGAKRNPLYRLMSFMGVIPPISWLGFSRIAPMPIDVLARGVARIVIDPHPKKTIYYAGDLRRRNTRRELRQGISSVPLEGKITSAQPVAPITLISDDAPFGWIPDDSE